MKHIGFGDKSINTLTKPLDASEFLNRKPNIQNNIIEKRATALAIQYGIPILFSEDDDTLYDFEEEALDLWFIGQEAPPELIKKLEDTMEERKERNKRNGWDW